MFMALFRCPDPKPPAEADLDSPEMAEAAAFIDSAEEDLRMLTRLARIGMALAEAQALYAKARLAAASVDGGAPLKPGEEPTAASHKIAQTVRRTIALKVKLAQDLEKRRAGLVTERASRRAQRTHDHRRSLTREIDAALTDAFTVMYGDGDDETDEGDALCREMLNDTDNLLGDLDEFRDWLERPVGETVAKLCVALGLAPDTCIKEGAAWLVNRTPSAYEIFREARAASRSP